MPATLAIDGRRFLVDGRPANAGVTLRGAPLDGLLLGLDLGTARDLTGTLDAIDRGARAGVNAVSVTLHPSEILGDASNSAVALRAAVDNDLAVLARVPSRTRGFRAHRDQRPADDSIGVHEYASALNLATDWLARAAAHASALVIESPHGRPRLTDPSAFGALRAAGRNRVLVGTEAAVAPMNGTDAPDFIVAPRWGYRVEARRPATGGDGLGPATDHSGTVAIPLVLGGAGRDLDDPDGSLGTAIRDGASWFLRAGSLDRHARLDAFLETIRAARSAGRHPSDHPVVALADQRRAFRRHAAAVRALGLSPAQAPAGAPR